MLLKNKITNFTQNLFSFGLYLTIFSVCFSWLRITPKGPVLISGSADYPFLYEVGIGIVFISVLFFLYKRALRLSHVQKMILILFTIYYLPIIFNMIFSMSLKHVLFGGEGRLLIEAYIFAILITIYPLNHVTIERLIIIIIFLGIVNAIFIFLSHIGYVEPMYSNVKLYRGDVLRETGFLYQPSRVGVLTSASIALALTLKLRKIFILSIILFLFSAILLSDTRSGLVAAFIILSIYIISKAKLYNNNNLAGAIFFFFLIFVILISLMNKAFLIDLMNEDGKRILALQNAFITWTYYPFGIGLGTINNHIFLTGAISPHNSFGISLLYGGIFSFIAITIAYINIFKMSFLLSVKNKNHYVLKKGLSLMGAAILTTALFEQVILQSIGLILLIFCLCALGHLSDQRIITKRNFPCQK